MYAPKLGSSRPRRLPMIELARKCVLTVLACLCASTLLAQGVQTGTIRGTVHDEQGLAVPGVTVTATSPALQGPRVTVSDAAGGFTVPNLPPGPYAVTFELSDFATVKRDATVVLGLVVVENVTLRAAGVAETVQVVAET